MRRRQDQPGDQTTVSIGDAGWIGVNMRLEPFMLAQGYASEGINMRFRNGVAGAGNLQDKSGGP